MAKQQQNDADDMMSDVMGVQNALGPRIPRYKVPEDGKQHWIRVLPGFYGKTGKFWAFQQTQHWIFRPNKKDMPIICIHGQMVRGKAMGQECPACNLLSKLQNAGFDPGDKEFKKIIAKMSTQTSYDVQVIDREEEMATVRRFSVPTTIMKSWSDAFAAAWRDGQQNIFDPESGLDFWVKKVKSANQTDYSTAQRTRQTPVVNDIAEMEDLLANIPNMETALKEQVDRIMAMDWVEIEAEITNWLRGGPVRKPAGGKKPPGKSQQGGRSAPADEIPGLEKSSAKDEFADEFGGDDDLPEAPDLDLDD